jgi:uncharacterized protein (DUF2237 family)
MGNPQSILQHPHVMPTIRPGHFMCLNEKKWEHAIINVGVNFYYKETLTEHKN